MLQHGFPFLPQDLRSRSLICCNVITKLPSKYQDLDRQLAQIAVKSLCAAYYIEEDDHARLSCLYETALIAVMYGE